MKHSMSNKIAVGLLGIGSLHAGAQGTQSAPGACDADPHYRQFDFWLGSWDVYAGGLTEDGSMELVGNITYFHNQATRRILGRSQWQLRRSLIDGALPLERGARNQAADDSVF